MIKNIFLIIFLFSAVICIGQTKKHLPTRYYFVSYLGMDGKRYSSANFGLYGSEVLKKDSLLKYARDQDSLFNHWPLLPNQYTITGIYEFKNKREYDIFWNIKSNK